MFDLHTYSLFDTFRGRAVSGPLHDAGLQLEFVTVGTVNWGDLKEARPDAQILAQNTGQLGVYPLDPLGDRDADGPIFPVGDVDPRLLIQEQVLGVIHDGVTVAFPEGAARFAIATDQPVTFENITVTIEDGALVARTPMAIASPPTRPSGSLGLSSTPRPRFGPPPDGAEAAERPPAQVR